MPKHSDEKTFNETLKRMLGTPPKPHDAKKSRTAHEARKAVDQTQERKSSLANKKKR